MKSNGNDKKSFVLVIMSALIMLIMVGSFTFAYFTAEVTANNTLKITANVGDSIYPVFVAYPEGNLDVVVTTADMLSTGASSDNTTVGDSAEQTLYVELLAGGGEENTSETCTFDLLWKDTGAVYVPSPNASSANLSEYTIKVVDQNGNTVVAETRVNDLISSSDANRQVVIAEDLSITSSGVLVQQTYKITSTIYNLNVSQNIYNQKYSSVLSVTGIEC